MSTSPSQPPRTQLVLATRGSMLALWQANYAAAKLKAFDVSCRLQVLKTTADRIQDRFLHELGGKGLFIKELEQALEAGEADLAVHSLKDMPAVVAAPFTLAAVLARHQPTDLLILGPRLAAQHRCPAVADAQFVAQLGEVTIGTGSLRRQAILRASAPKARCVPIRGNVDTRLRKLQEGEWDAIVLAEASIERLAISGLTAARLDPTWFVPCAGQGALAIESRANDELTAWLNAALNCVDTHHAITLERLVLAALGGDCHLPFGCYARKDAGGERWQAIAAVYDREGNCAKVERSWAATSFAPQAAADALAEALREAGAKGILENLGVPVPAFFQ